MPYVEPSPDIKRHLIHIRCPQCGEEDITLLPWTLVAETHFYRGADGVACPVSGSRVQVALAPIPGA